MEVPLSPFLKSSSLPRWGGGAHSLTQTALRSLRPDISLTSQSSPNGLRTPSLHSSCPLALRRLAFLTVPTQQNQPKRRLPRLRAVMKWSGLTLCVLLFALWLASGWWGFLVVRWARPFTASHTLIDLYIEYGELACLMEVPPSLPDRTNEWHAGVLDLTTSPLYDHWRWGVSLQDFSFTDGYVQFALPLWLPFLLIALPTGFLFYRDRKAKPGLCAVCHYDLRGLPETTMNCPECGTSRAGNVRVSEGPHV